MTLVCTCVNALFVGAARRCQDKNLGSRWAASNGFCSGDTASHRPIGFVTLKVSYNSHCNSSIPIQHTKIHYGV
ncbi:hypothetical protein NC652_036567 [Populus alba x Populus x berolinensis]|nr:hypothetical protein NC652_036567 [Populus alba x Populus x berolinensis]